jgi:benzoylformate decarboxylase
MGDGVSHAQAHGELAQLAEVLGAEVWGAMASEINLPWTHPLYRGLIGHMFGEASRNIVRDADAIVICGTYVFPDVFPLTTNPFRADAKIIQIDLNAYDIAKNHPVTMGLVSNPKPTLRLLAEALADRMTAADKEAVQERAKRIAAETVQRRERELEADRSHRDAVPLHMSSFAEELAKRLPENAILFDESLTYFPELTRHWQPQNPGSFFQTPGGTLGVGIPGAVGAKLAHPDRTVIGLTGDGGAMYTFQALWTAVHYGINAKFIVCNNRSYRLLKQNIVGYWGEQGLNAATQPFPPAFDIHNPDLDFVSLARGLGVPGCRVTQPSEILPAIAAMLDAQGPFLIDLILEDKVARPAG